MGTQWGYRAVGTQWGYRAVGTQSCGNRTLGKEHTAVGTVGIQSYRNTVGIQSCGNTAVETELTPMVHSKAAFRQEFNNVSTEGEGDPRRERGMFQSAKHHGTNTESLSGSFNM